MEPTKLSIEEAALIKNYDIGDHILLEIIKGMSLEEMKSFDVYKARYMKHYIDIQKEWLGTEKHVLQTRNGRDISEDELIEDLSKCHNGERFRVFYVLKYPEMVDRIN